MGSWGIGVYENDHALDLLSIQVDDLADSIEETLAIEYLAFDDIEGPLIYVHLLGMIAKDASVDLARSRVATWKATYLAAFDTTIGDRTAYVTKRRAVIVKTFDNLATRLDDDDEDEDDSDERVPNATPAKPKAPAKGKQPAKQKAPAKAKGKQPAKPKGKQPAKPRKR